MERSNFLKVCGASTSNELWFIKLIFDPEAVRSNFQEVAREQARGQAFKPNSCIICVTIVDNTFHDVPRSTIFSDIFVALVNPQGHFF